MTTGRLGAFGIIVCLAVLVLFACRTSEPTSTAVPPMATPTAARTTRPPPTTVASTSFPSVSPAPPTPTPTSVPTATPAPPTPTPTLTPTPAPIGWWRQDSGVSSHLAAVDCLDNDTCFAVGADSTILKTTDGGVEWVLKAAGLLPGVYLQDVDCVDQHTCYAANDSFQVLGRDPAGWAAIKTIDGGETWSAAGSGLRAGLKRIACPTSDTCYAINTLGEVYKTADGGSHWSSQTLPESAYSVYDQVRCTGQNTCYLIGDDGIFKSTDGGSTWVMGPIWENQSDVDCSKNLMMCYFMRPIEIMTSTDGVATWAIWTTMHGWGGTKAESVQCPDREACYVLGGLGLIYKTTDAGGTWELQYRPLGFYASLEDLQCPINSAVCYAVGAEGTILKTTDGGAFPRPGWEPVASGVAEIVRDIACPVSADVCYALAGYGDAVNPNLVLKTTDGGKTWTNQLNEALDLAALDCTDDATCYAVGTSTLLKTDDGWDTWSDLGFGLESGSTSGVDCSEPLSCYVAGGRGTEDGYFGVIAKTVDGGVTWSSIYTGTEAVIASVHCPVDGGTCYALSRRSERNGGDTTYQSDVLKTEDGGETWSSVYVADAALMSIHCPVGSETCLVVGGGSAFGLSDAVILKTEDGGKSWSALTSGLKETIYGIHCPEALTCYAPAGFGTLLKTEDGGVTWAVQFMGVDTSIQSVSCPEVDTCYAAVGGNIFKTTGGVRAGPATAVPIDIRLPTSTPAPSPVPTPSPAPSPTTPPFELNTVIDDFAAVDLLFDGQHVWAAPTNGNVIKLSPDGTVLISTPAGIAGGLAFDGENIWVALRESGSNGTVRKMARDGRVLKITVVGRVGRGLLFDGESIWVAILSDQSVTQLALDGTVVATFTGGTEPGYGWDESLAFDGENLWLASRSSSMLTKMSRNGQNLGTYWVGEQGHAAIAFDGEGIWVTNGNNVTKLTLDGIEVATYSLIGSASSLLYDGASMWVGVEDFVIRLALDGTELGRFPVDGWPVALAFDGASIWMANYSEDSGSPIQKLTLIED